MRFGVDFFCYSNGLAPTPATMSFHCVRLFLDLSIFPVDECDVSRSFISNSDDTRHRQGVLRGSRVFRIGAPDRGICLHRMSHIHASFVYQLAARGPGRIVSGYAHIQLNRFALQ
jgi:hypothetical protein